MARTIAEKERIAEEIAERLAHRAGEASWLDVEPLRRIAASGRWRVPASAAAPTRERHRSAASDAVNLIEVGVLTRLSVDR